MEPRPSSPNAKKPLACARGLPGGGTEGEAPCGPQQTCLLRLRCAVAGRSELLKVILQQADFYTAAAHALWLFRLIGIGHRSVAHAYEINAIHGNLMVEHQVTHHRLGHLLRSGDCVLALAR